MTIFKISLYHLKTNWHLIFIFKAESQLTYAMRPVEVAWCASLASSPIEVLFTNASSVILITDLGSCTIFVTATCWNWTDHKTFQPLNFQILCNYKMHLVNVSHLRMQNKHLKQSIRNCLFCISTASQHNQLSKRMNYIVINRKEACWICIKPDGRRRKFAKWFSVCQMENLYVQKIWETTHEHKQISVTWYGA